MGLCHASGVGLSVWVIVRGLHCWWLWAMKPHVFSCLSVLSYLWEHSRGHFCAYVCAFI